MVSRLPTRRSCSYDEIPSGDVVDNDSNCPSLLFAPRPPLPVRQQLNEADDLGVRAVETAGEGVGTFTHGRQPNPKRPFVAGVFVAQVHHTGAVTLVAGGWRTHVGTG